MAKYKVAVVGAAGMVGQKILEILEERDFPVADLVPLELEELAGEKMTFAGQEYSYQPLEEGSFAGLDFVFFAAGGGVSEKYAPLAVEAGARVIDNSSFFRMEEDVPLVVAEVNGDVLKDANHLIANPNCSTIQAVMVLKPLYDKYGINRIVYNTYQSVSGSGLGGLADLENDSCETYPYSIRTNTLPHIDDFLENGYTKEEMKMVNETRKILGDQGLPITATAVRVPIKNSHAISINLELGSSYDLEEVRQTLASSPGLIVKDDPSKLAYPLQEDSNGTDDVYVGRVRRDKSVKNGLNLWCTADNIRKGAATNSVQIAERML